MCLIPKSYIYPVDMSNVSWYFSYIYTTVMNGIARKVFSYFLILTCIYSILHPFTCMSNIYFSNMKSHLYKACLFSESESEEDWERGEIRDVTLLRDGATQGLGFSIRGGSEHALGVYVSEVIPDSPAGTGISPALTGSLDNGWYK